MIKQDIKPLFEWAKENGDANIYDRILMKVMPYLLKENIKLTSEYIENTDIIEVPNDIYKIILQKTEELIGFNYV